MFAARSFTYLRMMSVRSPSFYPAKVAVKLHELGHPRADFECIDGDETPAVPAIKLECDQLGELGRDVCHRIFCSTQAASRAEQGADFAESFVRRVVHNGDEQVTR